MDDDNNFQFTVGSHSVVMQDGRLDIDDCMYEDDPESPIYDLVYEIKRLRQFEEDHHSASRV